MKTKSFIKEPISIERVRQLRLKSRRQATKINKIEKQIKKDNYAIYDFK